MKKISLLLIALCLFTLVGCFGLNEITSLEFDNSPAATYTTEDTEIDVDQFSIKATFSDGTTEILSLTNSNLTVQGLNGEYLDVEEPGIHTIKVTYKGFSITFNYIVIGASTVTTNWAQVADDAEAGTDYVVDEDTGDVTINTNLGLAWFAAQVNGGTNYAGLTVSLSANIDMQEYEWAPINKFAGTFDGQGHSISNIRITKESHPYIDADEAPDSISSAAGLFGWVNNGITVKNLTLVNTSIDVIQNENNELVTKETCENYKNYGAVVGLVTTAGTATLENVNVVNFYLRGAGRLGGLIGYSHKNTIVNIKNCYVDGSFVSYNPVTSSDVADGEGDKVGGFIGQTANQVDISNSSAKVNIMGTRDLGGMIGYNGGKTTITNCQLLTGSVISASVAGGMDLKKGSRNIGGVVGTHAPTDKLLLLNDVNVANDIVIVSNSLYAYSSAGKYVGGFRGSLDYKGAIIITLVKGTDAPVNVAVSLDGMKTDDDALTRIAQYLIDQTAALAELNSK